MGIPLPFAGEFELIIMIERVTEEMQWVGSISDLQLITSGPWLVWQSNIFNESEMARSSECTEQYAQIGIDSADIVRDAW